MVKIAFLGNSHGKIGNIVSKYQDLALASDLGKFDVFNAQSPHRELIHVMEFGTEPGQDNTVLAWKNRLTFANKLDELYLDYASPHNELQVVKGCLSVKLGRVPNILILEVYDKDTVEYLKSEGFQLVHVLHTNPDSDRIHNLLGSEHSSNEELFEMARPLLQEFNHGSLCDTTITVNFNDKASIMKELHRLFL